MSLRRLFFHELPSDELGLDQTRAVYECFIHYLFARLLASSASMAAALYKWLFNIASSTLDYAHQINLSKWLSLAREKHSGSLRVGNNRINKHPRNCLASRSIFTNNFPPEMKIAESFSCVRAHKERFLFSGACNKNLCHSGMAR